MHKNVVRMFGTMPDRSARRPLSRDVNEALGNAAIFARMTDSRQSTSGGTQGRQGPAASSALRAAVCG